MEISAGNATVFQNLRQSVEGMEDVSSTWIPVELHPDDPVTKIPPFSMSWSLQRAMVTRQRIRALERRGERFDAALFNTTQLSYFLRGFRSRVPSFDSMDMTPALLATYGEEYHYRPRGRGFSPLSSMKQRLNRRIFREAAGLIPWSTWTRKSLIDDYGVDPTKVDVVPPGIELDRWEPGPRRRRDNKRVRVLFVGGEFTRKGGDLLARVARLDAFRSCEFHFVTKSFEGAAGPRMHIHDSFGPNDAALIDLYRASDVFVLPTRADFFSLASLEAMAMRLPVVTTTVGGIPDIVVDGKTGFLVPPDDEQALVEKLKKLVASASLRRAFGTAARKRVEQCFSVELSAARIIGLMKAAAERKNRA